MLSGDYEEYYITNLGSNNKEEFSFSSCSSSEKCNKKASRTNRRLASKRINIYLDRFLSLTSSMIPLVDQRDINEQCFRLLSFGLDVPKPDKFVMPSLYLAHMLYEQDVRLHHTGELWTNRKTWKPASDISSPIEIFPLVSLMKAANPEHLQELPVLANFIEENSPQPSQLGGNAVHDLPSVSRPSTHASTSDSKAAKTTGTKRKSRRRQSRRQNKSSWKWEIPHL